MPTKDLAPFSYISHKKNPLFNDKVWTYYRILVRKRVKSQGLGTVNCSYADCKCYAYDRWSILILRRHLKVVRDGDVRVPCDMLLQADVAEAANARLGGMVDAWDG